jgi:hypothetical protein
MNTLTRLLVFAIVVPFVCWLPVTRADTIQFKNGSALDGEIVSESDTAVVMDVRMGGGSIIRRTISKDQIASVTRETPEQKRAHALAEAYRKVEVYQLNPTNNFPLAYYDKVIKEVFQPFVAAYPDSVQAGNIKARMADWEQERQQVADGKVKRDGQWLTAEEVRAIDEKQKSENLKAQIQAYTEQKQYDKAVAGLEYLLDHETDADQKAELQQSLEKAYNGLIAVLKEKGKQAEIQSKSLAMRSEVVQQAYDATEEEYRNLLDEYRRSPDTALGVRANLAMKQKQLDRHKAELTAIKQQVEQFEQQTSVITNTLAKAEARYAAFRTAVEREAKLAAAKRSKPAVNTEPEPPKEPEALLEPFEVPTISKTQEVSLLSAPEPEPSAPPPPPRQTSFREWLEQNWLIAGICLVLSIGFFLKILKK